MNLSRAQILKMSFTVVATLEHKTAKILAQQVRKLFLSEFLLIVADPRLRLTNIQRWPIEIFLSVLELARWQILRSKKIRESRAERQNFSGRTEKPQFQSGVMNSRSDFRAKRDFSQIRQSGAMGTPSAASVSRPASASFYQIRPQIDR